MATPFCIFRRESKDRRTGKPVTRYCARFFDENGRVVRTTTLKAQNPTRAALEADALWKRFGISTDNPLVLDFLLDFWRPDSEYAKTKRRRGRPVTDLYLSNMARTVRGHLLGPLAEVKLSQLTVSRMERVIQNLGDTGLSPLMQNQVILAVRVPVTHWARQAQVRDPLEYLGRSAENPVERGTLSAEETERIIALPGANPRARAGVLLSALCGLRMGEVRGLQWADVDLEARIIHVRHTFVTEAEGLKAPKCDSKLDVPLPSPVVDALSLVRLLDRNAGTYVLWNDRSVGKPITKDTLIRGYRTMLEAIGIDRTSQVARNLTFHSLRHSFVTLARAIGLPDIVVRRLSGHRSEKMLDHYTHSENLIDFSFAREALESAMQKRCPVTEDGKAQGREEAAI